MWVGHCGSRAHFSFQHVGMRHVARIVCLLRAVDSNASVIPDMFLTKTAIPVLVRLTIIKAFS